MQDAILLYYTAAGGYGKNLLIDAASGDACVDQLDLVGGFGEFSNDGKFYASDSAGQVFLIEDWSVVYTASNVQALCFSNDSQFLVAAIGSPVTQVHLISTSTWTITDAFVNAVTSYSPSVAISPDNQWLVLGHSLGFSVWEVSTGNPVTLNFPFATGTGISDCAFSPNGCYLAISADYKLENTVAFAVFNTTTWEQIETANLSTNDTGWIECLKFTPDNQYLVLGSFIYIALGASFFIDGLAVMQTSNWELKTDIEKMTDMVVNIDFHDSLPYMLITKDNATIDAPYLVYNWETWEVIQIGKNIRYHEDKTVLLTTYSEPVEMQGTYAIYSKIPFLKALEGTVFDSSGEPVAAKVSVLDAATWLSERSITSSATDGRYCFTYLNRENKSLVALNPANENEVILTDCQPF